MVTSHLQGSRGYAVTLAAGLLAATAVAVGATKPWATATAIQAKLPTVEVTVSGTELTAPAAALGMVMLAAFGAVVATRGRLRQALGLAIIVCAAVVLVLAIRPGDQTPAVEAALSARGWLGGAYDTATSPWRWLVAAGAGACVVAGTSVARFGADWPAMGSRYDAPRGAAGTPDRQTAAVDTMLEMPASVHPPRDEASSTPNPPLEAELEDADVWRALDRGHDPTRQS